MSRHRATFRSLIATISTVLIALAVSIIVASASGGASGNRHIQKLDEIVQKAITRIPNYPSLTVSKQATPDLVQAGAQLTYTIYVTNTGSVTLTATVTDTLPDHIARGGTSGGTLILPGDIVTWTPVILMPSDIWTETVVVTVETDYTGLLTNVVQVTTEEGATGIYTQTSTVVLPMSNISVSNITSMTALISWQTDLAEESYLDLDSAILSVFPSYQPISQTFRGVAYAPGEYSAYLDWVDRDLVTDTIIGDVEAIAAANFNAIVLYPTEPATPTIHPWDQIALDAAAAQGLQITFRLEWYPSSFDAFPFDWTFQNCDTILEHYDAYFSYFRDHPDRLFYFLINIPLDDPNVPTPTIERQRDYVAYCYNALKTKVPGATVYANTYYGWRDELPQASVGDLVDGVSVVIYVQHAENAPFGCTVTPTASYSATMLICKDQFDYYLDKAWIENNLAALHKPLVLDSTGFAPAASYDNSEQRNGVVADSWAKVRAIDTLRHYLDQDARVYGWSYFKLLHKHEADWGLIDRRRITDATITTTHRLTLTNLFPTTPYTFVVRTGDIMTGAYTFTTSAALTPTNASPLLALSKPPYGHELVPSEGQLAISWQDYDPDDDATIGLYYDTNDAGCDGTLIVDGLSENSAIDVYTWTLPTTLPVGSYYVYGQISDGTNPAECDYSSGQFVPSMKNLKVLPATGAITVDGDMNELIWQSAISFTYATHISQTDGTSATVRALWDQDYVYVGFVISDTQVETSTFDWNGDSVSAIFVNGAFRCRQDAGGTGEGVCDRALYVPACTTLNNSNDIDCGFTVEMRIRWSELHITANADDVMPTDFVSVDHDGNPGAPYDDPGTEFSKLSWDGDGNANTFGRSLMLRGTTVCDTLTDVMERGLCYFATGIYPAGLLTQWSNPRLPGHMDHAPMRDYGESQSVDGESISMLALYAALVGDQTTFDYLFDIAAPAEIGGTGAPMSDMRESSYYLASPNLCLLHRELLPNGTKKGSNGYATIPKEQNRWLEALSIAEQQFPGARDKYRLFANCLAWGLMGATDFDPRATGAFEDPGTLAEFDDYLMRSHFGWQDDWSGYDTVTQTRASDNNLMGWHYAAQLGQEPHPLYQTTEGTGYTEIITIPLQAVESIRIDMTQRGTIWGYSLYEVKAYNPFTDSNLLLNADCAASSYQNDENCSTCTCDKALDGIVSAASRWSSEQPNNGQLAPQWLVITPTNPSRVMTITLTWELAYASSYDLVAFWPFDFYNQVLSHTTFMIADSVRYCDTRLPFAMYDLEQHFHYGEISTPNLSCDQDIAVTASSNESGFVPDNVIDCDGNTRWSSLHSDDQWIALEFSQPIAVDHIVLKWERAYGEAYTIDVSDDGITWTPVYTESNGESNDTDLVIHEIHFPLTTTRHIRMHGTSRGTEWGYSLWEFQVYGDGISSLTALDLARRIGVYAKESEDTDLWNTGRQILDWYKAEYTAHISSTPTIAAYYDPCTGNRLSEQADNSISIMANLVELAAGYGDHTFARQVITEKLWPKMVIESDDPLYGSIGSSAFDNLETLLALRQVDACHYMAEFTASAVAGRDPLTVVFTNTTVGDYTDSLWSFGDTLTSTDQHPTHTYASVGTYTITLIVNGPCGTDDEVKTRHIVAPKSVFLPLVLRQWPPVPSTPGLHTIPSPKFRKIELGTLTKS
ncbi:MAG: DUF11 domain-containing protein [Chloroflexi bacterium]|nr:DUF11 domain-containing protein [Chloroflexota bacterium]